MKCRFLIGFIFLVLGLGLSAITNKAPTPEKSETLWYALPAFGVFLLFLLSVFSLGAWIRTKLKLPFFSGVENGLFDLSVGSVFFYALAYLLTPIGLFSSQSRIILWICLSLITFMGVGHLKMTLWFQFAETKWSRLLLGVPLLIVVLKLIEGLQFPAHGDAYNVYLPAPRTWAETGNFNEYLKSLQYFLATSWESLPAWGTALMGLKNGHGLDLSQFFAQWCTGGIAVFGVLFASLAFCMRLSRLLFIFPTWFPAISIVALQIPVLRWTENLAKNDFGVCFWGFAGFYFSEYLVFTSSTLAVLGGMLIGAAVVGKFTSAILAIVLAFSVLFRNRKTFVFFSIGGLLGGLPIFIRNFSLTSNPAFPWLSEIFHSPLLTGAAKEGAAHATAVAFQMSQVPAYALELVKELPLLPLILLILLWKPTLGQIRRLSCMLLVTLVGFTVFLRPSTEIRYQGPTLVIVATLSAYLLFFLVGIFTTKYQNRFSKVGLALLTVAIVAVSNISVFTLAQIGGKKFVPWPTRTMQLPETGGPNQLWIRTHLSPSETILILGDAYPYYLMDYEISSWGTKEGIEELISHQDTLELKKRLKLAPARYLYLSSGAGYVPYRPSFQALMNQLQDWNQTCKIYSIESAQVWDLPCLNHL